MLKGDCNAQSMVVETASVVATGANLHPQAARAWPEKEAVRQMVLSPKGYWSLSKTEQLHQALDNQYWSTQGLIDLVSTYQERRRA